MNVTRGQSWELGQHLKELRIEKGWLSISKAVNKTGVCCSSIRRLEAGRCIQVRPRTIHKLSQAYGAPIEETLRKILLDSPPDQRPPDTSYVTLSEFQMLYGRLDSLEALVRSAIPAPRKIDGGDKK